MNNRIEELTGFRWPAECLYCDLVTEDPDAYFRPKDFDEDEADAWTQCYASPTGLHEPQPVPPSQNPAGVAKAEGEEE